MAKRFPEKDRKPKEANTNAHLDDSKRKIVFVLLAAIVVYALIYCLVFVNGPSYLGDDIAYAWFAHSVVTGHFVQSAGDILSIRILQIYPIAFFYWLFGVSLLSSAAWDIVSFLGTLIIVFYLGKEIYNEYAGLLAALLFAFFPTVVRLSITMSDNMPMLLFASLGLLALLYGERKRSKSWYFVSGVSLMASSLVMPEGLMAIGIAMIYVIVRALWSRFKGLDYSVFYVLIGALAAVAILFAFNYLNAGNPFITFTSSFSFYQTTGHFVPENGNLQFYIATMFPYKVVATVLGNIERLNFNPISVWKQIYIINYNSVGFYFYFAVLAIIYLALRKEKRASFALFWFLVGFAIMEFDPYRIALNPFSYQLQHRLDRYLTLIAPPAVLLISIAFVKIVEGAKRNRKYLYAAGVSVAVIFLVVTAIGVNLLWSNIMLYERYSQVQIANYLGSLPNSTRVYYTSGQAIPIYMGFNNLSRFVVYDEIDSCTNIKPDSYIALPQYIQVYGLNYTPSSSNTCSYWVPISLRGMSNLSGAVSSTGAPAQEELYYVPQNQS